MESREEAVEKTLIHTVHFVACRYDHELYVFYKGNKGKTKEVEACVCLFPCACHFMLKLS